MTDDQPNFGEPEEVEPPDLDSPLPEPETPETHEVEDEPPQPQQQYVPVEQFEELKQLVTELQMKQRRDDDVEQTARDAELHEMKQQLEAALREIERIDQDVHPPIPEPMDFDPNSTLFIGSDDGTDVTEAVPSDGEITPTEQGRVFANTEVVELNDNFGEQNFYALMYDATANKQVPVRIAGGGSGTTGTGTTMLYIHSNRTMGGAYKAYILASDMFEETIDSGGATFAYTDLVPAPTTGEEVTVLNQDEEGQSTHSLTAATQIKHIVLGMDTGMTDAEHSDCRVFLIGDSDSEACEE